MDNIHDLRLRCLQTGEGSPVWCGSDGRQVQTEHFRAAGARVL